MRAIAIVALFVAACGDNAPTCEECLASTSSALQGNGEECWPYCEAPPDMDADGIPDASDNCPDMPETDNGHDDADGCPDVAPPPPLMPSGVSGVWQGLTNITVNGGMPFAAHQTLMVTVQSDRMTGSVAGFCPDGSGSVALAPSARPPGARWHGLYVCPPGPWDRCPTVDLPLRASLIFFDISITENGTGVLVSGRGTALLTDGRDDIDSLCDTSGEFISLMDGGR